MDNSFLKNLHRAAQAGMAHYATPDTWHAAIVEIAKANRDVGETPEQAEARLTRDDPTVHKFDLMRREALAAADVQKAGRPRKHKPENVCVTEAESRLFEMAKVRAQRDNTSFEMAFVKVIDTPEGAPLYREIKDSRA